MNINNHTSPQSLEKYSFVWSEVRLVIAAAALFLGGTPPIFFLPIIGGGLASSLLTVSWIISGVVSGYLVYRWNAAGRKLFGTHDKMDMYAFFVNIVSGFNLGLTGLLNRNIGMSVLPPQSPITTIVFIAVGIAYLVSAYRLYVRWNAYGKKIF